MTIQLMLGDCLELMRTLDADSVDAVVTDPPGGISFMGKDWDGARGGRDQWIAWLTTRLAECYRVAKPGARMLCWALPRTSHWTGTAVEDAGWKIEDKISHLFGSGFPKHKSKLKPACEDWWLAIKPAGRAVGLNIDDCRIATTDSLGGGDQSAGVKVKVDGWDRPWMHDEAAKAAHAARVNANVAKAESLGRWPANVALTCCGSDPHDDDCAVAMLDRQSGTLKSGKLLPHHADSGKASGCLGAFRGKNGRESFGDSGGASRFFYTAKASRSDRGEGNDHPTVKSADLMDWLIRLITRPGDVVLDPFAGSGSTGKAAIRSGRDFIGIERDPAYFAIAERRIAEARSSAPLFAEGGVA